MEPAPYYPDFEHSAKSLKKFIAAAGIFTIMLHDGRVVNHMPADPASFKNWLSENEVMDMRSCNTYA